MTQEEFKKLASSGNRVEYGGIVADIMSDGMTGRRKLNEFVRETSKTDHDWLTIETGVYPVREWGGYIYIVTGTIDLTLERQSLEVVDVTDTIQDVALFPKWPGQGGTRDLAVVSREIPDEGRRDLHVLGRSGKWIWRYNFADLQLRVKAGSQSDYRRSFADRMEQIETSVDAGGSIGL